MSSISNRFYITALEDGSTIHGNLSCEEPLTQAWNGTTAFPDWTDPKDGQPNPKSPTIFLTLFSGADITEPTGDGDWFYNDPTTPLTFDNSGKSTGDYVGLFQKTTKSVTYNGRTISMPALKIIGNLASSDNTDLDTITYEGTLEVGGAGVKFKSSIQVRISSITEGSFLGVINFSGGKNYISADNETVTMTGFLYDSNGEPVNGITTDWYLNEVSKGTRASYSVTEDEVVDHAVVKCVFKDGNDVKYTAFAFIDDLQDPEYLYIQYGYGEQGTASGNAASMRASDSDVIFRIWVGTRDSTDVKMKGGQVEYNNIKVKLYDAYNDEILDSGLETSIPNPDANDNNWRNLTNTMLDGKATLQVAYNTVYTKAKKNLTGIVMAQSSQS